MQPFDPRLPRRRYAPRVMALGIAVLTGAIAWKITGAHPSGANAMIEPAASIALQQAAYTQAERRPGLLAARALQIMIVPGETLEGAVRRAGVDADEAHSVVSALTGVMDTVHIQAGKTFQAMVAPSANARGSARLVGLSMRTGPASTIALSRSFDGALLARKLEEEVRDDTAVSCSQIDSTVGESAAAAGADNALVNKLVGLFSQKIDFARDIQPGDRLCLVFDRRVSESGRLVGGADLRYAELDAKGVVNRFYAFDKGDGKEPAYYDAQGQSVRGLLLATPIANPRITSSFGRRNHPILGYTRAHQGVDFGASSGTPIFAAGDGVIEQKRWSSGYGNWLLIRHNGEWETGYGHISRYADGIRPGVHVTQGQVVAYVGSTGLATGPHLHFEVWDKGQKINPVGARGVQQAGTALVGTELASFQDQKAQVDTLLAGAQTPQPKQLAMADAKLRGSQK